MKIKIDRDHTIGGWIYFVVGGFKSDPVASYPAAKRAAVAAGHEVDNGGWLHRLLMWQFQSHALDGYPEWEIEREKSPAFVRLAHQRGEVGAIESHALASAWDDVAEVDFYQRDWTSDALPTVAKGDTYWSGWWFATIAERERFLKWCAERGLVPAEGGGE
jgi:hypothetical protein